MDALPEDIFEGLIGLYLAENQLGALPEDVFDGLGSLKSLDLSLEDVFDGLGNLKYLRLFFNQLSALPDDVFDDLSNRGCIRRPRQPEIVEVGLE